jgi:hypothetical protein
MVVKVFVLNWITFTLNLYDCTVLCTDCTRATPSLINLQIVEKKYDFHN